MLDVTIIPILNDNYAYLLQSGEDIAIVDPGESGPIIQILKQKNISPNYILNTHHHWDHTNGNKNIKESFICKIIGPKEVPNVDCIISEGDILNFGNEKVEIILTSGHTAEHICFYFPQSKSLFSGDTLFSMGCGKIFEGTAEDMFKSFEKLKALPDNTKIYCGHEYTQDNGEFCLFIDPKNQDLIDRVATVKKLRELGKPSIPTTVALEKKTNIFMRANTAEEFKKYRDLKDNF